MKNSKNYSVYILQCQDRTLYTGIARDIKKRLKQHNEGSAAKYTRSRRPVKIIYQEGKYNKSSALKREYFIKSLPRQGKIKLIKKIK